MNDMNIRLLLESWGGRPGERSEFPLYATHTGTTFHIIRGASHEERLSRYIDWVESLGLEEGESAAHVESLHTWLSRCAAHGHRVQFGWA
jgi:hypothetical protein